MPKLRERGGGPAVGLANDYTRFLSDMLWGTGAGATAGAGFGAPGQAMTGIQRVTSGTKGGDGESVMSGKGGGIAGIYGDLLSQGAGNVGGAFRDLLYRDLESQRKNILTQFANIGGGQSSGAAQALAKFNAEAGPKATLGIANLQMEALRPLLESLYGLSGKGISQRQLVQEYSPIENVVNTVSQVGNTVAKFINPMAAAIPSAPNVNIPANIPGTEIAPPQPLPSLSRVTSGVDLARNATEPFDIYRTLGYDTDRLARSGALVPQFGFK